MATIRHKMGRMVGVGVCRVPVEQPALAFTIRPSHDDKKSPAPLCQGGRGNVDRTNLLPRDRRALEDEPHGVDTFPRKVTSQDSASIMEAGRPTRLAHRPSEILCKIAHS
jgi:hypothetical protein